MTAGMSRRSAVNSWSVTLLSLAFVNALFLRGEGGGSGSTGKQQRTEAQALLLASLPTSIERLVGAASFGNLTMVEEIVADRSTSIDTMPDEDAVAVVKGLLPLSTPLGAAVRFHVHLNRHLSCLHCARSIALP